MGDFIIIKKTKISLLKGDITRLEVDAIVNAANSSLMGGGGVDGAIHRAGGPQILEECKQIIKKIGRLPTGEAVITSGGNMKVKFVIHTVGPIWNGGSNNEEKLLANSYYNSLKIATENNIKTIAFPSISTGVYGYPIEKASIIAINTVKKFITENDYDFEEIIFVLFSEYDYSIYKNNLKA
ncbi:MAG TPA: O-acetyl-ADP-ribose deacetylase [Spirochaetota bacterium]|nr:O-acetyl-ADP-ribose deacetylase [Spirochaetota bacterium]